MRRAGERDTVLVMMRVAGWLTQQPPDQPELLQGKQIWEAQEHFRILDELRDSCFRPSLPTLATSSFSPAPATPILRQRTLRVRFPGDGVGWGWEGEGEGEEFASSRGMAGGGGGPAVGGEAPEPRGWGRAVGRHIQTVKKKREGGFEYLIRIGGAEVTNIISRSRSNTKKTRPLIKRCVNLMNPFI
uniref:Uncharacterized protein n=1 Tax=Oryza rufipogon TaxID=4529 RepID=A0A0E0QQM5_ORYRU